MHNEQDIVNAFFDDLGKKEPRERSEKQELKSKWPLYEIKGTHGTTYDVCETLEGAQLIAKHAKFKRYEIWQINKDGKKILIERSHNEAGFASIPRDNPNNAFSILKGFKHVA
jgi:hypothetical protein